MYVLHFVSPFVVTHHVTQLFVYVAQHSVHLDNFLFIGITLYLRLLLGPLYPILAHLIAQRLMTHTQQAGTAALGGTDATAGY